MRSSEAGAALRRRGLGDGLKMEALTAHVLALEPALSDRGRPAHDEDEDGMGSEDEPAALLRALVAGVRGGRRRRAGRRWQLRADATAALGGGSWTTAPLVADDGSSPPARTARHSRRRLATGCRSTPARLLVAFARGTESLLTRAVCDPTESTRRTFTGAATRRGKVESRRAGAHGRRVATPRLRGRRVR